MHICDGAVNYKLGKRVLDQRGIDDTKTQNMTAALIKGVWSAVTYNKQHGKENFKLWSSWNLISSNSKNASAGHKAKVMQRSATLDCESVFRKDGGKKRGGGETRPKPLPVLTRVISEEFGFCMWSHPVYKSGRTLRRATSNPSRGVGASCSLHSSRSVRSLRRY